MLSERGRECGKQKNGLAFSINRVKIKRFSRGNEAQGMAVSFALVQSV